MKKIEEIEQLAAQKVADALKKTTAKQVEVSPTRTKVLDINYISAILMEEEICVMVRMDILGDIKGKLSVIFSKDDALDLFAILSGKVPGTTKELTELDKESLKEVTNIIAGNYLSIFSNTLQSKMVQFLPIIDVGLITELLKKAITPMAQKPAKGLVIKLDILFPEEVIKGHVLLIFDQLAHKMIMDKLI